MSKSASRYLQRAARVSAGMYRIGGYKFKHISKKKKKRLKIIRTINHQPKYKIAVGKTAYAGLKTDHGVNPNMKRWIVADIWLLADYCDLWDRSNDEQRQLILNSMLGLWARIKNISEADIDDGSIRRMQIIRQCLKAIE